MTDIRVALRVASARLEIVKAKKPAGGSAGTWAKQPRWPGGTALGGQWKTMDGDGLTMPPVIAGGAAGSNPGYHKKVVAAYEAAKQGDIVAVKAAADALAASAAKFAEKGAKSSHVKWTAQAHQYVTQVAADMVAKPKAEAAAASIVGPMKLADMAYHAPKPGGSNEGGIHAGPGGQKWLIKGNGGNAARAYNEVLASKLLDAAGIPVAEMRLVDLGDQYGGGIGVASKMLAGPIVNMSPKSADQVAQAQKAFAVHALLGNYDALGLSFDNTVNTKDGLVHIDPGGSFTFSATGKPKKFTADATDFETMRDPKINPNGASVYGKMNAAQLQESAKKLLALDDATIDKLTKAYGDPTTASEFAKTLKARRDAILAKTGLDKSGMAIAPVAPPVPDAPKAAKAIEAAAVATGSQSNPAKVPRQGPAKPTEPKVTSSFPSAQKLYNEAIKSVQDMKSSADLDKVTGSMNAAGIFATSAKGKKLHAYAEAMAAHLAGIEAGANAAKLVAAAEAAKPVVAQAKAAPVKAAHPNYENALLPADNQNAPSHNKKVSEIAKMAFAGNEKGILALNFGTNTYGKKQAALANQALAAIGSVHTVAAGQKANAHPALAGTVPTPPSAPAAPVKLPPQPAPAALAVSIPKPPDFTNWNGTGKPLSTQPKINADNQAVVNLISQSAKSKTFAEMQALTYSAADGTNKPITSHPSKHVVAYYNDVISALQPVVPVPTVSVAAKGKTYDKIAKDIAKAVKDEPTLLGAAKKIGRYAVLGKFDTDPFKGFPPDAISQKNGKLDVQALYDQSRKNFDALTAAEKAAVQSYTGSGYQSQNNAKTGVGNESSKKTISALKKAGVVIPTGTTLSRKFSFTNAKEMEQFLASSGSIVKDFGIISTSTDPDVWSGQVHLRITTAPGVKGLYVARNPKDGTKPISVNPGEKEVVLPYGTKFFVRSVSKGQYKEDHAGEWGTPPDKIVVDLIALPD